MKKSLFIILILIVLALVLEIHGYNRGYEQGQKATNTWWIDQKSRIYDTSEVLKKNTINGYNQM